ncbi:MAG: DNA-binding protein [Xanthomarina sp.]|uniref:ORF6N domain-containing protein n=1 Tax=Xanthomarina sp. TaxID=1931211 RepID=UPI000C628774|nr:ORF6N domain-containing protein [Xanthomarina sp.]MAL23017.1 DNA-binding protein [Xanthomarina sp.]MBF62941.1 DNA-binding protein [Xanthomarina sp.]|tara:strand:- start:160 stop:672 length:513 start_codon:yes stop_codon:yes gene_type:complete
MQLQVIQNKIYQVRGERIMLDFDLAEMYGVETRALKQAVRRNLERFPEDFMFQLSKPEWQQLITNCDNLPENIKFSPATPFAFTEQGVAMLSSVLNSKKAIEVNIAIIRAFVVLRQHLADYKDLKEAIAILEKEMNTKFKDINQALHYLLNKDQKEKEQANRKQIGYKRD